MSEEFKLSNLRFNPHPPPIRGGREFSRSYREAILKVEDIFSHYALGNISYDHAMRALLYARNAIIPNMPYPEEIKNKLLKFYDEAIDMLRSLRTPERVKQWLLSNGPPRAKPMSLDQFMKRK